MPTLNMGLTLPTEGGDNGTWDEKLAPQGTLTEKIIQGNTPTRSTTANTAVTVVCPATPNVLWKATASYRVGA